MHRRTGKVSDIGTSGFGTSQSQQKKKSGISPGRGGIGKMDINKQMLLFCKSTTGNEYGEMIAFDNQKK